MAKITLHSSNENRKSSKVVFLHSGVTVFDEQGKTEVDVTDEQLAEMLESYADLYLPKEKGTEDPNNDDIKPQVEENELGKSKDEDNDIGGTDEDDNDLASPLHGMLLDELKATAKDSGFPDEEWNKLKKPELKAYLLGKLNPQA